MENVVLKIKTFAKDNRHNVYETFEIGEFRSGIITMHTHAEYRHNKPRSSETSSILEQHTVERC